MTIMREGYFILINMDARAHQCIKSCDTIETRAEEDEPWHSEKH